MNNVVVLPKGTRIYLYGPKGERAVGTFARYECKYTLTELLTGFHKLFEVLPDSPHKEDLWRIWDEGEMGIYCYQCEKPIPYYGVSGDWCSIQYIMFYRKDVEV